MKRCITLIVIKIRKIKELYLNELINGVVDIFKLGIEIRLKKFKKKLV